MALGGGNYTVQNKVLPGSYINIVSLAAASAGLSDRGTAAIAMEMSWGEENKIFELTESEASRNALSIFGCVYSADELKGIRDIFKNANKLYLYRLNSEGVKASNTYGTAKYSGTKGNSIKTVIETNVDDEGLFDVSTYFSSSLVDKQTVASAAELLDNDYVIFNKEAELSLTAGTLFENGTDGTVSAENHQQFLDKLESMTFNALGVVSSEKSVNDLYAAYTKRMRDERGIKFQTVVYGTSDSNYDYEGVIKVKNCPEAVYWVLGVTAGTKVNKSALNKTYDGEFSIPAEYKQSELEEAIKNGEFTLHKVGDELRVLDDINSLVSVTEEKGEIFKSNQTVRVADQIATDTAAVFNSKYLGKISNDASGRESFWGDMVSILKNLRDIRAIEDFDESAVTVERGETKNSITVTSEVEVIGTMAKLYMTCVVA